MSAAIIVLGLSGLPVARSIQAILPGSEIFGSRERVTDADQFFDRLAPALHGLLAEGRPIIGLCAAGILIRALSPALSDKRGEPPVLAVSDDGEVVVPLLGGLTGANELARKIAEALGGVAAITASGSRRFGVQLEAPPPGYELINPERAKSFTSNILAGRSVRLIGEAEWLSSSDLPIHDDGELTIRVETDPAPVATNELVYRRLLIERRGHLTVVGLGPGDPAYLTPAAAKALREATDLVGYETYLALAPAGPAGQRRHASGNRVEIDRAIDALDMAEAGAKVAVVSSGDPGIFAMASAVLEAYAAEPSRWPTITIDVEPGISAMQLLAARIGAPLGHDFCVISLSDIRKPWELIEQRLTAAAKAGLVIALYNPASTERREQIARAKTVLLRILAPDVPVMIGRNLARPGETTEIVTLGALDPETIDMRTVLIIGSTATRVFPGPGARQMAYSPRSHGD